MYGGNSPAFPPLTSTDLDISLMHLRRVETGRSRKNSKIMHPHHPHHHPFDFASRRGEGRGHRGGPFGGRFGGGNPFGGNPFGGNPFGGNPFFRRGGRARKGDVRTAILVLLAEEPRNGYQLMQEIEKRSAGAWRPSPGATYPALQQLEDEGLVRIDEGPSGKTFSLTDAGREEAKAAKKQPAPWDEAAAETEGTDFRELFHQVAMAAMQVARAGTATQIAEARKILLDARRALYRLLAESDDGADEE